MMITRRICRWRCYTLLALLAVGLCVEARAQVSRVELVESGIAAYLNLETDRAREYFVAAVNPVIQEPDSTWSLAVQYLVQLHLEAGNRDLAQVWTRWAVRHVPSMQVDTLEFLPDVVTLYYDALASVGGGVSDREIVSTTWEWPPLGSRETLGAVRLDPQTAPAGLLATVIGLGTLEPGSSLTAPAGSYTMEVSAEGYEPITVTREILPGVTSVLGFNLTPAANVAAGELPAGVESATLGKVARFSVTRFRAEPTCGTGYFVSGDGLLLTTYSAIRGAEELAVDLPDGRTVRESIFVAAWDSERNVAVLKLPVTWPDSIIDAAEVADDQSAWALVHPACGAPQVISVGPVRWSDRANGRLIFADSLDEYAQGGPIVSQSGELLGLTVAPRSAIYAGRSLDAVNQARRNLATRRLATLPAVARQENHLYGSVLIRSDLASAVAQVTPLESWHWPELAAGGAIPLVFSGPMGRYALELRIGQQAPHRSEFTVEPGLFKDVTEPQIVASGGGRFPVPIAILGAVGAAAAVGVLVLGGGDDGGNGTEPPPPTHGWIRIPLPTQP